MFSIQFNFSGKPCFKFTIFLRVFITTQVILNIILQAIVNIADPTWSGMYMYNLHYILILLWQSSVFNAF